MNTLKERVKECGSFIPLFIMTSPENIDETKKHLEINSLIPNYALKNLIEEYKKINK